MSITEIISSYPRRKQGPDIPHISPESTSVEWMNFMTQLRDQAIKAMNRHTSDLNLNDIDAIDSAIAHAAEAVLAYTKKYNGARKYDEKGNALDNTTDIKAPLEIRVLEDAITIYKTLPTDNSRALVEALITKYDDQHQWQTVPQLKEKFYALLNEETQSNLLQQSDN
jgi:hypothetical protein